MGRGSGGNVANSASKKKAATAKAKKQEASIKQGLTTARENFIFTLKGELLPGKAGSYANKYIIDAANDVDDALKMVESVKSVSDVNSVQSALYKRAKDAEYKLDDMAKTMEANADDATNAAVRKTYNKAATALRMAAFGIRSQIKSTYANSELIQLEDLFKAQKKWL